MPKLRTEKVKLEGGQEIEVLRVNGGKFAYLDDANAEREGDFIDLLGKHKSVLDERETLSTRATTAEGDLKKYRDLGAVDDIAKAMDQAAKLKTGELLTIEKVGEIEKRAAEKRDLEWKAQIEAKDAAAARLQAQIEDSELLQLMGAVASAKKKLANDKEVPEFVPPADGLYGLFRPHFRKVDGKWLASTETGENWERGVIRDEFKQPVTDPLAAVKTLGKGKDWLFYKPPGNGTGQLNDGGGGDGKSVSSEQLKAMPLEARNQFFSSGGQVAG